LKIQKFYLVFLIIIIVVAAKAFLAHSDSSCPLTMPEVVEETQNDADPSGPSIQDSIGTVGKSTKYKYQELEELSSSRSSSKNNSSDSAAATKTTIPPPVYPGWVFRGACSETVPGFSGYGGKEGLSSDSVFAKISEETVLENVKYCKSRKK
jgi:hypothetical protein